MSALTVRASGPRAVDDVWERYAHPDQWVSWAPQIRSVSASADRLDAGVTGQVRGPLGLSVDFVVESWDDEDHIWSWTARRGPVRLRLEHRVSAGTAGGANTYLRVHGPLPVVVA